MTLILKTSSAEGYNSLLNQLVKIGYKRSNNYGKKEYFESLDLESEKLVVLMDYIRNEIHLMDLKDERTFVEYYEEIPEYSNINSSKDLLNMAQLVCKHVKHCKVKDEFSREVNLDKLLEDEFFIWL